MVEWIDPKMNSGAIAPFVGGGREMRGKVLEVLSNEPFHGGANDLQLERQVPNSLRPTAQSQASWRAEPRPSCGRRAISYYYSKD